MKKLLLISALFCSANGLNATPGTGGYLGKRLIIGAEMAYSPFYTSVKDFYTKYNFQYGGNINFIVSRRSQLGLNYNRWSLGHNEVFGGETHVASDRVKGMEFGMSIRTFRKKQGGIAPIGKFYDIGLSYSQNKFFPGKDNPGLNDPTYDLSKVFWNVLTAHVAFGTQMVFKDRFVANTGIRFGLPVFTIDGNERSNFMQRRIYNKEYCSVFFGVGILL